MEPYICFNCNGAEYRCGSNKCCSDCYGGKYCWEENVVLILKKSTKNTKNNKNKNSSIDTIRIDGKYDGYRMWISNDYKNLKNGFYWENFGLKPVIRDKYNRIKNNQSNKNDYSKQLSVKITNDDNSPLMNKGVYLYCKSCYDN